MIRTLIVDDEKSARERLRLLLGAFDDLEIVGEAEDGLQALERIGELEPDLVLLDIQMPGCNGLEVAASLASPRPAIVFCTAFDEYAVDAFEVHAVDYLLKPVSRARLAKAIDRVRAGDGAETGDGAEARDGRIDEAGGAAGAHPTRFLARRSTRVCVVPGREVLFFASDGGQTKLQTLEGHYWMQPSLADLERRLNAADFFRISRAAIVKLDQVREVQPVSGGYGEVKLADGTSLEVSRRRYRELLERLDR